MDEDALEAGRRRSVRARGRARATAHDTVEEDVHSSVSKARSPRARSCPQQNDHIRRWCQGVLRKYGVVLDVQHIALAAASAVESMPATGLCGSARNVKEMARMRSEKQDNAPGTQITIALKLVSKACEHSHDAEERGRNARVAGSATEGGGRKKRRKRSACRRCGGMTILRRGRCAGARGSPRSWASNILVDDSTKGPVRHQRRSRRSRIREQSIAAKSWALLERKRKAGSDRRCPHVARPKFGIFANHDVILARLRLAAGQAPRRAEDVRGAVGARLAALPLQRVPPMRDVEATGGRRQGGEAGAPPRRAGSGSAASGFSVRGGIRGACTMLYCVINISPAALILNQWRNPGLIQFRDDVFLCIRTRCFLMWMSSSWFPGTSTREKNYKIRLRSAPAECNTTIQGFRMRNAICNYIGHFVWDSRSGSGNEAGPIQRG
ncbi:hypothetical protein B0H17DRAFT_1185824 [Mycena rosella]|uniref:Uncharacterized protein n=1 Tax=Mycena rosella TaxID=1033263 RepID=A0AAD7CPT9_MYCRO|nr:hypothetical protein B0H17DRAFT_1185824 [Mycena rosella]